MSVTQRKKKTFISKCSKSEVYIYLNNMCFSPYLRENNEDKLVIAI